MIENQPNKFINHFKLSARDLEGIVNGYRTRTIQEYTDLKLLNEHQGISV